MSGKYLLDTNIVIALFAEDPSVQKHIAKAGGDIHPVHCYRGSLFRGFQVRTSEGKYRTYRKLCHRQYRPCV